MVSELKRIQTEFYSPIRTSRPDEKALKSFLEGKVISEDSSFLKELENAICNEQHNESKKRNAIICLENLYRTYNVSDENKTLNFKLALENVLDEDDKKKLKQTK